MATRPPGTSGSAPASEMLDPKNPSNTIIADDGLPIGVDLDGEPGGERVLWEGRPSLPLSVIDRITTRYRLTNERLVVIRGFVSRRTEEIDLYRVNDVTMKQSILERAFGLGDVTIQTTDATAPQYRLHDIANPERIKDMIRQAARLERQRRRVLLRDEV